MEETLFPPACPQPRLDPGDQNADVIGLGQVVVAPGPQRCNDVLIFPQRGEEENGDLKFLLDLAAEGDTIACLLYTSRCV